MVKKKKVETKAQETKKPEKKRRGIRQFLRGLFWFLGSGKGKAPARQMAKPVAASGAKPRKREVSLSKQLRLWRKKSEELTKRVRALERQLKRSEIAPRQALGGVRVVYATAGHETVNLDKEIRKTKSLMKLMEIDYHKMRATPEQFRTKMLEYRERMHLLQLEKDELAREGMKIRHVGGRIKEIALKSPEGGPEVVGEFEQSIRTLPLEWSSDSAAELAEVASTGAVPRGAGGIPAKAGKALRAKKAAGKHVKSRMPMAGAVKKQAVKIKPAAKPMQVVQKARAIQKPASAQRKQAQAKPKPTQPKPAMLKPAQAKAKPALKKPLSAEPKPLQKKPAQAPSMPLSTPATGQKPVPVRIVGPKPGLAKPMPAKPEPAAPKQEKSPAPLTAPGISKTGPPKGILSRIKSATISKPLQKPVPPKPALRKPAPAQPKPMRKPMPAQPKSVPQKSAPLPAKKIQIKAEKVDVKAGREPMPKPKPVAVQGQAPKQEQAPPKQEQAPPKQEQTLPKQGMKPKAVQAPKQEPKKEGERSFKILSQREKIAQWAEERRAKLAEEREKQKRIAGELDGGAGEHGTTAASPAKAAPVQEPRPKQGGVQEKTGALRGLFKGKPANKSEEERIARLEERMESLMQKHNVSSSEVKREAMAIDAPSVVGSFNKLIGLLESKYEGTSRGGYGGRAGREPLPITTALGMDAMLQRSATEKSTPTELKKKRIVTDFDRTLSLVTEREKVRINEIASELNIAPSRVEECCDILERGNLIEIHYPAIGKPYVQIANYAELKAARKEKEKDEKPKKKGAGKNG